MNTKILAVLVVALLAAIGAWLYQRDNVQDDFAADDFLLTASFTCTDASYFVAEFPDPDTLRIVVDGTLVRTVPFANEEAGQRYEDSAYAYVFAGEEATVTNKTTGAITTCEQPFDPNFAPVNFGDAGEGGGVQPDAALVVSESIGGKWQSVEDVKFVREFKAGGIVEDSYDGEVVSTGTAVAFTNVSAPQVSFPLERDTVYLQLRMSGSQTETLNFKVNKLTPEELELTYIDRGGVLRFTYVQ